ncbi:sensor histidine kinase [Paenibacillus nasutitermitis]|uniref:histidine kinase n=1 Tax=Paenibacillus nasutitermitis TaxID=1652958 RepID=A0A916ZBJ0_9BACL|nr:sensor histidine kinase [Paenibacillus nasutitermitis]GGD86304.1 sensor histidine kinase [Paenibacillus nasutitermitis]
MAQTGVRPRSGPPRYFSFIFLFYLAFPLYELWQRPLSELLAGLSLIAVFAALYLYSSRVNRGRLVSALIQLIIIALFCLRYGEGFLYMAFFPSPIIGMVSTKKQLSIGIGALLTLFIGIGLYDKVYQHADEMIQLVPAMLVMLFMPFAMRLGQKSRELREKLHMANEEIARLSKNEERQRISRDLHDTLGHTLSLITLKSELAEKLIVKNPQRAVQEVKDIHVTSRAALKQVRELVSGMNTVTVRDELVHAKQILAAADIVLDAANGEDASTESPLADNILGMCLREAVTNIVKHSSAKVCTVEWMEETDFFRLRVSDDGSGIDPASGRGISAGNGLKGMKERLKLVEGNLNIESLDGRGTTVTFTVPRVAKTIG